MGIGVDTTGARDAVADGDHGAPFGEARAQRIVLGATLTQAVEPLGDLLARRAGQRLGAGVDLDAGNDALIGEQQRERRFATRRELAQRLVIEDDARDEFVGAWRGEQQFAIGAAVLLGRLHADRIEALLDGAAALVGGQDSLALGDQCPGGFNEFVCGHGAGSLSLGDCVIDP